jgi:hypothetical protein
MDRPLATPLQAAHDLARTELAILATGAAPPFTQQRAPADLHRCAPLLLESARDMRSGLPTMLGSGDRRIALPLEAGVGEPRARSRCHEAVAQDRLSRAAGLLGGRWNDVSVARNVREFNDLGRALANARRACQTARACRGPILAELTAIGLVRGCATANQVRQWPEPGCLRSAPSVKAVEVV